LPTWIGRSPVLATLREMADLSSLRTISPAAGKTSPGVMSADHQCKSAQCGDAARGTEGGFTGRALGEKPQSNRACVHRGGRQSKTRRVRNETLAYGLSAMSMAVKECEKA